MLYIKQTRAFLAAMIGKEGKNHSKSSWNYILEVHIPHMSTTQHLTPEDHVAALYYKKVSDNSDQCIW